MRPPTSRSICGEVIGKRLSARRTETRKDRGSSGSRSRRISRGDRVDVERRPPRAGEVAGAEHLRQPIAHAGPVRAVAEHDLDTPLQRAHLPDVEVRRRLADVPDEPRHEPRPVPAL